VSAVSYDYDCGDKRSYGSLAVEASFQESDLPFKTLKWDGCAVGSSGGLESGWDEKCLVDGEAVEVSTGLPEVEVPHYYSGLRTVGRWEDRAHETLVEDLQDWLAGEFEAAKEGESE
jgi:hypothetical protein